MSGCSFFVEEANPLKQGLKRMNVSLLSFFFNVEEANPLKQGLKHDAIKATGDLKPESKRLIH